MNTIIPTPAKSLSISNTKDNLKDLFKTQEKTIFHFLQNHTATASMVSKYTGIPQKNICRFKRDLEKRGLLFEVEKKLCKVTGFRAWFLSTNPNLKTK
jgi:predicted transcriptional regulator